MGGCHPRPLKIIPGHPRPTQVGPGETTQQFRSSSATNKALQKADTAIPPDRHENPTHYQKADTAIPLIPLTDMKTRHIRLHSGTALQKADTAIPLIPLTDMKTRHIKLHSGTALQKADN